MPESSQRVLLNHEFMNELYKKMIHWVMILIRKKKLNPIEPILRFKILRFKTCLKWIMLGGIQF